MARLRYAGVVGTIGSGNLTSSATTHTFTAALTYGDALSPTTLPTLTGSDYFLLSILDASGNLSEVVKVTAYNSGTGAATIVRGQEGTTGVAHTSGDRVTMAAYASDLGTNHDLRWWCPPSQVSIDEFEDASLASAWVRVDGTNAPSGEATYTESGDVISAVKNGTGSAMHGLMVPLSGFGGALGTGDAIVTCHTAYGYIGLAYVIGGLVLSTNATYGAGNQLTNEDVFTSGQTWYFIDYTNWTTTGTPTALSTSIPQLGFPTYRRIVNLGSNVWRADRSFDGINWLKGSTTKTWSNTPTHAGLMIRSGSTTTVGIHSFEFLRRDSGVS